MNLSPPHDNLASDRTSGARLAMAAGVLTERLAALTTNASTGCMLFTGTLDRDGYGRLQVNGRRWVAHRAAYELAHGPIPDGLTLDHLCRVRNCVNPAHLEPVTLRENVLRGEGQSARNAVATHCHQGHPFDEANTYRRPGGGRTCRACKRITDRRDYQRRVGAI